MDQNGIWQEGLKIMSDLAITPSGRKPKKIISTERVVVYSVL
jgi:hypothetical protein